MFKNAGVKLQTIGKVLCVLMILGSIAGAIAFCFAAKEPQVLTGVLVIVGGFFAAWLTGLCLIALGKACQAADDRAEADAVSLKRLSALERKLDLALEEQAAEREARLKKEKDKEKAKEKKK